MKRVAVHSLNASRGRLQTSIARNMEAEKVGQVFTASARDRMQVPRDGWNRS